MNKCFLIPFILLMLSGGAAYAEDEAPAGEPVTKTLVWPDGTRYVGGVADGKRTGKGTIFWQDGTRFVGQFENDMRNGPGTMILPDGTVYTGFFKNDELVDTESTLAAASPESALDDQQTAEALGDTELPMEADSISEDPVETASSTPAQVDEHDLLEPQEPAAIIEEPIVIATEDATEIATEPEPDPYSAEVTEVTELVKQELIDTVDLWAAAWSDQNVPQYLANYSGDFKVPGKQSRRTWEALRRTRLNRPSYINLDIEYQRFELVATNVVDVFFRQAYRSNTYSDLTDKVLRLQKEGADWKILLERSR